MTATADRLLSDLPPYLSDEPRVQRLALAFGNEFDRLLEMLDTLANEKVPSSADSELQLLAIWERILGLPENPEGETEEDRREKVGIAFRARKASSGADWVARVEEALSGLTWSYVEGPGPYQLSITLPSGVGGYTVGVVRELIREITPAHLELFISYEEGFIVGDGLHDPLASVVGESLL